MTDTVIEKKKPVARRVTVNAKQRLYVIPCGSGYSCFGFDNATQGIQQFAELLGEPPPAGLKEGTLKHYKAHQALQQRYIATNPQSTFFDPGTEPEVKRVLEMCRVSRTRVRIILGDKQTGRSWLSEYDVIGRVSRSMGALKTPLLIKTERSHGGTAILTACILRIVEVATKRNLYVHPAYVNPDLVVSAIPEADPMDAEGYRFEVFFRFGGEAPKLQARFKNRPAADAYAAFMRGERMKVAP